METGTARQSVKTTLFKATMFAASKSGSVVDAKDPQFNYVTMLLHGDGTNGAQNNTFLDSSTNNFTITRNGNTTQGTFTPYGSNWSNYFDGTGDWLRASGNTAFDMGSGDFTIEAWIYPQGSGNRRIVDYANGTATNANFSFVLLLQSANTIKGTVVVGSTEYSITSTDTFSNTWVHVALVRNGTGSNNLKMYINGVSVGTPQSIGSSSINTLTGTPYLSISSYYNGSGEIFNGYISNVRIVKGTAVYTSNFTPSTTPLTAITNTSLLTCADNRFIDDSTNNFTITKNGDVSVQRFSPFSPTTAYSTSVIGGSGYFDGTGDYLKTAANVGLLGANDFSIEAWVYPTSAITSATLASGQSDLTTIAGSSWSFNVGSSTSAALYVGSGGDYGITSASPVVNAWNHVVFCRTGGTISTYLNGSRVATRTDLGTNSVNNGSTSNTPSIGANPAGNVAFPGYIAGHQRIIGSGGFSATGTTITVPTAPPTAVTNTNLLLNFTNAGILDNAMMNDLETVGNAQISTSVKKYGTGSMYFDGTGDGLVVPDNVLADFGSGSFTIEFWLYLNSVSGEQFIYAQTTDSNPYTSPVRIQLNGSQMQAFFSTSQGSWATQLQAGSANSTATWYHFAIVRNGTSVVIYRNGTSYDSGTLSGTLYNSTEPVRIGYTIIGGSSYASVNGYIDDLRITKGVARYTTTFTPPTAAFPNN
jgi:hypothetical protein